VSTQLLVSEHRGDRQSAVTTTDAILRALGVVTLMGLALVHIVQLVPTFQTMQLLGVGYLLLIAGTVVVGAPTRALLWAPVAILGVGAMVAYAFTRIVSTPLDNQDVGNWACTLGMAALFLEAALVALSAYAIATHSRARQVLHAVSDGSTIPYRDE
jgi:hypothetical protein